MKNVQVSVVCRNDKRTGNGDGRSKRRVADCSKKRQLKFRRHLLRHKCIERDVFLGIIEGRRATAHR